MSLGFCAAVSAAVAIFARPLLCIFIDPSETEILNTGMHYLRTEGLCYVGIGLLFLLYATYRGLERAGMSIVLTGISLGLRVALAYALAPVWGLDHTGWLGRRGYCGGMRAAQGLAQRAITRRRQRLRPLGRASGRLRLAAPRGSQSRKRQIAA